jgi:hypothetical protein
VDVKREHFWWLPSHEAAPAPGSTTRFLDREDGIWCWERQPIVPGEALKKRVDTKKANEVAKPRGNKNQ